MNGRHNLYSENGREVVYPVVFQDAVYGWVRELPGTRAPRGGISRFLVEPVVLRDPSRRV